MAPSLQAPSGWAELPCVPPSQGSGPRAANPGAGEPGFGTGPGLHARARRRTSRACCFRRWKQAASRQETFAPRFPCPGVQQAIGPACSSAFPLALRFSFSTEETCNLLSINHQPSTFVTTSRTQVSSPPLPLLPVSPSPFNSACRPGPDASRALGSPPAPPSPSPGLCSP